jgi:glycosyltransferase involved in cell wall biosynthesis
VKLAILGPAHPLRGGIVYYLAILHRELVRAGHQVMYLGFKAQYPERVPNLPIVRKLRFPGSDQRESGGESIPVPSIPLFVPWNPWSWWRTARAAARSGAQAVILKWWVPFFGPGYLAVTWLAHALRRDLRVIAILDNVKPHERWPLGKLITQMGLGAMDGFVAQSRAVEADFRALLPGVPESRIRFAAHPTYDFDVEPPPDAATARRELGIRESKVVLFFGFIKAYKGLMVLLDAVPKLRALLGPDFRVLVVGDFYEDATPYHERIAALGIADRLTLVSGYVPNEEVPRFFTAADVVVLPYLSATQSGIVQIAYRYDRPVVTTNVGGLPEFVTEGVTGYMVPPGDPAALAGAIARFYREADREAMARAIAARRAETSWAALVTAITELALADVAGAPAVR